MSYIYLPIEMEKRELSSKLLLAAKLINEGYTVIIGQQWEIFNQIKNLPKGLILFKGYSKIFKDIIKKAYNHGHKVLLHDEELFIQFPKKLYISSLDESLKDNYNAILTSGEEEYNILKQLGYSNLIKWGNPRSEFLGNYGKLFYQNKINEIKQKYGDYILINTNFGVINSLWGDQLKVKNANFQSGHFDAKSTKDEELWQEIIKIERKNWDFIYEMILKIDGNQKIIIRPHPSEDLTIWEKTYSKFSNVEIIREGNHIPWTLASKVLIQSNCLTGIEASLMGVPCLSIISLDNNSYYEDYLVDDVTECFHSVEDIINRINKSDDINNFKRINLNKNIAWNMNDDKKPSDILLNIINNLLKNKCNEPFPKLISGKPVVQLLKKCDIKFENINSLFYNINLSLNFDNKYSIREIDTSLFIISNVKNEIISEFDYSIILKNLNKGRIKESIEIINNSFINNSEDVRLLDIAGTFYSKLGLYYKSFYYYSLEESINNNSINLKIDLARVSYLFNPKFALRKITEALNLAKNNQKLYFIVLFQTIEIYNWSKRNLAGLDIAHAGELNVNTFEFINDFAKNFYDSSKIVWKETSNRSAKIYELVALSTFAYKGFESIKTFVPLLRNEFPDSVWKSIIFDTEDQNYYKISTSENFDIINITPDYKFSKIILLSCDYSYFIKFGLPLIRSIIKTGYSHQIVLHIMVNDQKIADIELLISDLKFNIFIIHENVSYIKKLQDRRLYYHVRRFSVVNYLINQFNCPILLLDVDSLVKNNVDYVFEKFEFTDVSFRVRPGRLLLWNQFNASVVLFNPSHIGKSFASFLSNYLNVCWVNGNIRWGADQLAMFLIYNYFTKINSVIRLGFMDKYIVDYDYHDEGYIWQNSGISKFFDSNSIADELDSKTLKFLNYENSLIN
jgi:surface carbohydrate biosynthesis protein